MIIEKFTIKNFKSIENIEVPLKGYGKGENYSNCLIFLGINESGKSNIIDAFRCFGNNLENQTYDNLKCKFYIPEPDKESYIDLYLYFIDTEKKIKDIIKKSEIIDDDLLNLIDFNSVSINNYINSHNFFSTYLFFGINIKPENETPLSLYRYIETEKDSYILLATEKKIVKESIVKEENLTFASLYNHIQKKINGNVSNKKNFLAHIPQIIYWKAEPSHLIYNSILLDDFIADTDISQPLKSLFFIAGYTTDKEISSVVSKALNDTEIKAELEANLSEKATSYINNIWKEHKIKFRVRIDADKCDVYIEDTDAVNKFYTMDKRSDGFKQFVSLILSLSAQASTNQLQNNIILLDEPEVHLHPSGIRFMRDELLKIGKNNIVLVTTHSHFMVDTNTVERHFIVEKNKVTTITQMTPESNIHSDEVLSKAFGLSFMKELLPDNILLVEGGGDKKVIEYFLRMLHPQVQFVIKQAGGCSKMSTFARFMDNENIPATILLDDDDEGRAAKKEVLKLDIFNRKNTYTLRDIHPGIVEKGTLEDFCEKDYLEDFLKKEGHTITIDPSKPFIDQVRTLKINKEQINSLKTKLSEDIIATFNTLDKVEKDCPLLKEFIDKLAGKLNG